MLGDDPIERRIHAKWMARAWILRHPYYNYTHTPGADAEEYARRQSELQSMDFSFLLN